MDDGRIAWHPGFACAMQLELGAYRKSLHFETEHELNRQPLRIDLLVVKKDPEVHIDNDVAAAFRGHNVLEFKSERDSLTIDDLYKSIAYACLYKAYSGEVDGIHADDVTVTLVRHARPQKLFANLHAYCKPVGKMASGIYRVDGFDFPVQVVVTGELDATNHVWLASLASDLETMQLRRLVAAAASLQGKGEQDLADSVLDVVARANSEAIEHLKEEDEMGKSLYEIMKPEIDEAVAKARVAAIKEGFAEGMSEGYDSGMKKGMQAGMQQGMQAGMQQGMQQGKELGAKEGRLEAIQAVVKRMLGRPGFTQEDICDLSGATPEEVRRIADSMGVVPA